MVYDIVYDIIYDIAFNIVYDIIYDIVYAVYRLDWDAFLEEGAVNVDNN